MIKAFSTLGVLGVMTGRVLGPGGFGEIHEVLDHLYPGIMTIGCAMMADTAAAEVKRQIPAIVELPQPANWSTGFADYAKAGLAKFGPTIEIEGPHGTGNPDMLGR